MKCLNIFCDNHIKHKNEHENCERNENGLIDDDAYIRVCEHRKLYSIVMGSRTGQLDRNILLTKAHDIYYGRTVQHNRGGRRRGAGRKRLAG